MTTQLAVHLTRIYQRGFAVDLSVLEQVKQEFTEERDTLVSSLEAQVRYLMGDRPINLNSPEQLSWVIYSRKPKDKKAWPDMFDQRMNKQDVWYQIRNNSVGVYKQKAKQCNGCKGKGKKRKERKEGTL